MLLDAGKLFTDPETRGCSLMVILSFKQVVLIVLEMTSKLHFVRTFFSWIETFPN